MLGTQRRWLALLPLGMLFLSMLACGGFQVRVTPTPGPPKPAATAKPPTATTAPTATMPPIVARQGSPTAKAPPATATPATKSGSNTLTPGKQARITADLVNVRSEAKSGASKVGTLTSGAVVTVRDGPVSAENFTWYQVDNGSGMTGWIAAGPSDSPWLVPEVGDAAAPTRSGPHLVDRAIKVGDLVQVTTKEGQQLTVRDSAGKNAEAVARVMPGTQFTVRGGPTTVDNYTWWQLEGEEVKGWAVEGDSETRWLTPVEQ
jgi:SH3-like domain-containing protein